MLKRFEQFSATVFALNRDIQKIERNEMVKYGYKGAFAGYLVTLNRFPEGLTATRLCELCDKDKAAVSRIVTEMEKQGLLQKDGSEKKSDYRAVLQLTEAGKKAAIFVQERAKTAVFAVGAEVSDADREIMYAALKTISAKLHALAEEGLPQDGLPEK